VNQVAQTHDPTAHAEVVAIRKAAAKLLNASSQTNPVKTPPLHNSGLPNRSM
jgi:tRNA(Arg) A34 adenosine deaminase TadA